MKRFSLFLAFAVIFPTLALMAANEKVSSGSKTDLDSVNALYSFSLAPGKSTNDIRAIAIAKSNNRSFVWYNDGIVTSGTTSNPDLYASYNYSCPPGKNPENLVAAGISNSNRTYAYWDDGTVSSGSTGDPDYNQSPLSVSFPPGKDASDLMGIAITPGDVVTAFWKDQTVSTGWSRDLDAYSAPVNFSAAPGKEATDLVGVAISNSGRVYAWNHGLGIGEAWDNVESDIDALVNNWLATQGAPGITVAATKNGRMVFNKAYGYADVDTNQHMKPHHRTSIGSISKIMTSLGFLKEAEFQDPANLALLDAALYSDANGLDQYYIRDAQLAATARFTPIVAMAINQADDHVVTYYDSGLYSIGKSSDLDYYQSPAVYTLPSGKTPDLIRAIASNNNGVMITWYDDGSYSRGTMNNLGAFGVFKSFLRPQSVINIVGMACSTSNKIYTWYDDNTLSIGTESDLAAFDENLPYTLAPGKTPFQS